MSSPDFEVPDTHLDSRDVLMDALLDGNIAFDDELAEFRPQPMTSRPYAPVVAERIASKTKVDSKRPLTNFTISQRRFEFSRAVSLTDRHMPDKIAEYRRQQIPEYSVPKLLVDQGFQAGVHTVETSSQTITSRTLNKAIQYTPQSATADQMQEQLHQFASSGGLSRAVLLMEDNLFETESVDPLNDPMVALSKFTSTLSHRVEALLRPVHTLQYAPVQATQAGKKSLTAVCWHPLQPGVLAYVVNDAPGSNTGSAAHTCYIVVWDLADLLSPKAILEAADTVTCICWSRIHNNILLAGLSTGQVCVYELQENLVGNFAVMCGLKDEGLYINHLTFHDATTSTSANPEDNAATDKELGFSIDVVNRPILAHTLPHPRSITHESELLARSKAYLKSEDTEDTEDVVGSKASSLQPILPAVTSVANASHTKPVTSICALPPDLDLNKRAQVVQSRVLGKDVCNMFLSVSTDGKLLYWDLDTLLYNEQLESMLQEEHLNKFNEHVQSVNDKQTSKDASNKNNTKEDAADAKRPRWREMQRKQTATGGKEEETVIVKEDVVVTNPFILGVEENTSRVLKMMEGLAPLWQPFYGQQLVKPGGDIMHAVALQLNFDLTFCVGDISGEVGVGTYAVDTLTDTKQSVLQQVEILLGKKSMDIANNNDIGVNKEWQRIYSDAAHVYVSSTSVGDICKKEPQEFDEDDEEDALENQRKATQQDQEEELHETRVTEDEVDTTVFSPEEMQDLDPVLRRVVPVLSGGIQAVCPHPVLTDIVLVIGTWHFAVWHVKHSFPIFCSTPSPVELTCGAWSPSKASVLLIGATDGNVYIWDILDSVIKPQVCSTATSAIVSISLWSSYSSTGTNTVTNTNNANIYTTTSDNQPFVTCVSPLLQLLAVGDAQGKLHILELSHFARQGNKTDISVFRNIIRQEQRRIKDRIKAKLHTCIKTRKNLSQILHSLDSIGLSMSSKQKQARNASHEEKAETDSTKVGFVTNNEWTEADEQGEYSYQQMLKDWKSKLTASTETDDDL